MKKRVFLALTALCMTLLMLAACSNPISNIIGGKSDAEKIVGKWSAAIDLEDTMKAVAEGDSDVAELLNYLDLDGLEIYILFNFKDNGKVKVTADEDRLKENASVWIEKFTEGMEKYVQDAMNIFPDEYEDYGIDLSELADSFSAESFADIFTEGFGSGEKEDYALKDGLLYIGDTDDEEDAVSYKFDGNDKLVLDVTDDTDIDEEVSDLLFPLTLERVS